MNRPKILAFILVAAAGIVAACAFWILRPPPEQDDSLADKASLHSSDVENDTTQHESDVATRESVAPLPATASEKGANIALRGRVVYPDGRVAENADVRAFIRPPQFAQIAIDAELAKLMSPSDVSSTHNLQALNPFDRASGGGSRRPSGQNGAVASTKTDPQGTFELHVENLPVFVEASIDGYRNSKSLRVTDPSPLEIQLEGAAQLTGRVLDPHKQPVAGADVHANLVFDPFAFASGGASVRQPAKTKTDENGWFHLSGVPFGENVTLRAGAEGWAPSESVRVLVTDAKHEGLELVLLPTASLTVKVLAPDGHPATDARVSITSTQLDFSEMTRAKFGNVRWRNQKTNDDGKAKFEGFHSGTFRVEVKHDLWLNHVERQLDVPPTTHFEHIVNLEEGRVLHLRVVNRLDPTIEVTDFRARAYKKPGLIDPLGYAAVESEKWHHADDNNRCALRGIAAGQLQLEVKAPGYTDEVLSVPDDESDMLIEMNPTASVEGIVVSRVSGDPISSFEMLIRAKRGFSMDFARMGREIFEGEKTLRFSAEDGRFRIDGMDAGTYTLKATAADHAAFQPAPITLEPGETRKGQLFFLNAEGVIEGIVLDENTRLPISQARVKVHDASRDRISEAMGQFLKREGIKTDEEGRFRLDSLSSGTYRLKIAHPDYAETIALAGDVREGRILQDVTVYLNRGAMIHGTVYDDSSQAVPGSKVFVNEPSGTRFRSATTNDEGQYEIKALAPGTYVVTLLPEQFAIGSSDMFQELSLQMATQNVTVEAGQTYQVDFGLDDERGSAFLEGRITCGGSPVEGALITAYHPGDTLMGAGQAGLRTSMSNEAGHYRLPSLEPGVTVVQVQIATHMFSGAPALVRELDLDLGLNSLDLSIPQGVVSGKAVDADTGEPIRGISVSASSDNRRIDGSTLARYQNLHAASALTGDDGTFKLEHLAPGRYEIRVGGTDPLRMGSTDYALSIQSAVDVTAGEPTHLGMIRLRPGGVIRGRVVHRSDSRPVPNVSVFPRLSGSDDYLSRISFVHTDANGEFEYRGLPDQLLELTCQGSGFAPVTRKGIKVVPGGEKTVNFVIDRGTEVSLAFGRITRESLATLNIEVRGPDGVVPLGLLGMVDLFGSSFKPPEPGLITLGTFAPGDYSVEGSLDGKRFSREIQLNGEPSLRIRVNPEER